MLINGELAGPDQLEAPRVCHSYSKLIDLEVLEFFLT